MAEEKSAGSRTELMMGNIALSEGAVLAGCRYFAAYPITPANEISEYCSRRMPEVGGIFIQMEDEIATIGSMIGAAWAGSKAMTATSGPGFSLMQEHLSFAANLEVPLVIANIQRVGPGSGRISEMSGDVMQAKWGGHGGYEIVALAPATCQEMFDLTIEAFNYAGTYRVPVIILGDAMLAHLYEMVHIPSPEELKKKVMAWQEPSGNPREYIPFTYEDPGTGKLVIPPLPRMGTPYHPRFAMASPHGERGNPVNDADTALTLLRRISDKICLNREKIVRWESRFMEDAEVVVLSYGIVSRPCLRVVKEARREGIKVGYLRLITLWPFPEAVVAEVCQKAKSILVPEMNYGGQVSREVERMAATTGTKVLPLGRARLHKMAEIFQAVKELAR